MQVPGEMQQPRSAMKSQGIPMSAIKNVLHQGGATPYPPNGLNPVAAPPIESASAYVPPSSFLQNIMNPLSNTAKPQSSIDYLR
jgi:hypothetical protein